MKRIPLSSVPNQTFSVTLDDVVWTLTFRALSESMCVTIERDGETVVNSQRIVAGAPLLVYDYLITGNMIFITQNDELPWWEEFGTTQFLIYLTADEVAEYAGS